MFDGVEHDVDRDIVDLEQLLIKLLTKRALRVAENDQPTPTITLNLADTELERNFLDIDGS